MTKSVVLTWELPLFREEGAPLPVSEIAHTDIELSLDGGANYVPLNTVLPGDPQTQAGGDLSYGTYWFRFVVEDIAGLRGLPLDFPVDVPDESAPGQVVNVQVTLS
jgi:hypothetical protein